ncbi:MAG: aminoglycoside phosphotransferase family protein [Bacteroidetes bacterium]|nr:aminoglycoside phosphotransferase family protein [Bacteroidota bacterium]
MELKQAQQILDCFPLKGKVVDIQTNNEGLINQTFIVSVQSKSTNRWVLQSINTQVFPQYEQGLENILKVKNWLEASNFPYDFPTPIEGKYVEYAGEVWRLFPFVEESSCFQTVESQEQAFEAAQCLGSFYKSLDGIPVDELHITLPNFHNGVLRLQQLAAAAKNAKEERIEQTQILVDAIQQEQEVLIQFDVLNKELPQRVVHFDTKISNFLFEQNTNKVKAIIDLDTLMPGTVLSDIGDMIRTYSNRFGEESKEITQVFADQEIIINIINGFTSTAVLSEKEKAYLYFAGQALSLMQCVRFLTDYLNNDAYYHTAYPAHNWMRAQNQWALYSSLKG